MSQKKFRNFFYNVCPISSLVTQHTIAKTTGYRNWSLLFVISTVAGDGPDLTDLILEDIEKFTSLIVCISSKVKSEKALQRVGLRPPSTLSWARQQCLGS